MRSKSLVLFAALISSLPMGLLSQQTRAAKSVGSTTLAQHPPMGWNSWDAYGLTITEPQFRDNVDVLATKLKPFGWQYAVIDEGWFLQNPHALHGSGDVVYEFDQFGRYNPVPERFPSALVDGKNLGFKKLGEYVHAQGLKFGIHIVRGIPRESVKRNTPIAGSHFKATDAADQTDACPWDPTNWGVRDTPAGQAWYDSLLAQYATWGVDFLKVDCISSHPYKLDEIRMIHRAIAKTGRPIILSLSPGPTSPGVVKEIKPYAQMWRISDDMWDIWRSPNEFPRNLYDQFVLAAGWAPYSTAGSWPDADMLPIGYLGPEPGDGKARDTRLTHAEQQTMLTLWSMMRSPLILGANLTRLDDWTTTLLTNRDVIEVDQNAHDQRQEAKEGDVVAWTAAGKDGVRYLALFNLNDKPKTVTHRYSFYNLPAGSLTALELWSHESRPTSDSIDVTLTPHSSILLELKR